MHNSMEGSCTHRGSRQVRTRRPGCRDGQRVPKHTFGLRAHPLSRCSKARNPHELLVARQDNLHRAVGFGRCKTDVIYIGQPRINRGAFVFYLRSRQTYLPRIALMSLMRSPTFSHASTCVRVLLTSASPLVRDGSIAMPCHLYGGGERYVPLRIVLGRDRCHCPPHLALGDCDTQPRHLILRGDCVVYCMHMGI